MSTSRIYAHCVQSNDENTNKNIQLQTSPLVLKLNTALKHVRTTLVIGSSNKISDIKRTNYLAYFYRSRYSQPGYYVESLKTPPSVRDMKANATFDPQSGKVTYVPKKWYFHSTNIEDALYGKSHTHVLTYKDDENPLCDPQFTFSNAVDFFLSVMLFQAGRFGNCGAAAILIADYLWKHNEGINRIEIVSAATFDHELVLINRLQGSDLYNSKTWGDGCWGVDVWYEKNGKAGMIFHASEFTEKIEEIKQFAIRQREAFIECYKGVDDFLMEEFSPIDIQQAETLKECQYDIVPSIHQYPTYSTDPFKPIESYYFLTNDYPLNLVDKGGEIYFQDKATHKLKFSETLRFFSHPDNDVRDHLRKVEDDSKPTLSTSR